MDWNLALTGLFWGLISAVSLPLGAVLGLWTLPTKKITSALMAFGGGALLFALTIELFGHAIHEASDHGHIIKPGIVLVTMVAALLGGLIFLGLNMLLNSQGAFLRKAGVLKKYVVKAKRRDAQELLSSLSKVKIFQSLPAEVVAKLIPQAEKKSFPAGHTIFRQGDPGDMLYCIISGSVDIGRGGEESSSSKEVATLGKGDVFGEMALISNQPRIANASAASPVEVWTIPKTDFEMALQDSPQLQKAVHDLAAERLQDLSAKMAVSSDEAKAWQGQAIKNLENLSLEPTEKDIAKQVEKHGGGGGAAKAIWLGIALDGIPESLVIGLLVVIAAAQNTAMNLAFIAGVFLANLPEAMSSAVTMQKTGMKFGKIFWMWMSLTIMTGLGSFIGAVVFPPHPEGWLLLFIFGIEGLAAGAMLTMIAETMLPEAFEQGGGPIVGISTLLGFLAALAVKLIH